MADKLGLALSGGGLRASFFHIGTLAQMAEQGLLRHVEVISAVSGGSIIAALYYLHLKKLLESRPDAEIGDADYVRLIQNLEADFSTATRKNLRMLTFADFGANWRMGRPDYSRSDRIAELYDELLYRPVLGKSTMVEMRELLIHPQGEPERFHPHRNNTGRRAKVPVLILNATTLNTGRNWHFTAKTMGEPVRYDEEGQPIFAETDSIPIRLRRPRPGYASMTPRQQDFPLGAAVAASAGVPGLFPPMAVSDLYRDGGAPVCVQLVDGGVHDNQGIDALLFEGCTRFVVSDASGQMDFERCPETAALAVTTRAATILQDQVRNESLTRLFATRGRENVAFLHLRKGLEKREIAWIDAAGKPACTDNILPSTTRQFGVAPEVQERLAAVRTDLDAFTEVEAGALMLDGYLIGRGELERLSQAMNLEGPPPGPHHWRFRELETQMAHPCSRFLHQLEVARYNVGKALLLIPWLAGITAAATIGLGVLVWPALAQGWQASIPVSAIGIAAAVLLLDWLGRRLTRLRRLGTIARIAARLRLLETPLGWYQAGRRILLRAALPVAGTLLVRAYLRLINPLFLKYGRLERLKSKQR